MKINDMKPQVGIFEVVDGYWLFDTEDVQPISKAGVFFEGETPHLHLNEVKKQVLAHPNISKETKELFKTNPYAYLKYPRGRVDYNTNTKKYHIMASKKFFTNENLETVLRAFYLPSYGSGKIVLEADENHYSY